MDFTLTEEQVMIRDAAAAFLAERCDSAALRKVVDASVESVAASAPGAPAAGSGHDAALWAAMGRELGWCALTVPEAVGGMGLAQAERVLLMEQMGRRLPAVPYFASACLAADALQYGATPEAQQRWLAPLAEGALAAALVLPRLAAWNAADCTVAVRAQGSAGFVLDGVAPQVMGGAQADVLLVPAREEDGGIALYAVAAHAAGLTVTPLATLDATRALARVELAGVQVDAAARIGAGAAVHMGLRRATTLASLALAAEQVGGAQQCLDLTLAYLAERVQFGRTIASFQAVKHRCAQMMVALESARSMVYGAARLADSGIGDSDLELEIASAKHAANHALFYCAAEAIQLHGGVGFTWEYDPQLYFKRAQAAKHWFGSDAACLDLVAHALSDGVSNGAAEIAVAQSPLTTWLSQQLDGEHAPFAQLRHRGGPGDEDAYPHERKQWERALAQAGWLCPGWPVEHGGQGLSLGEQVSYHEQYARAGGPGRMGHIGEGLIGPTLIALGTPDQQRRHLPGIASGEVFWAQGYSEPSAGSDLANVQTRAVRDEATGDWLVTGQKVWTSLAHESQWIFVVARCEAGSKGGKGLIFLLMPLDQPGVEIRPIRQISGSAEFNEVFFDGARAQACDVVGKPGEGWQVAMALLGFERGLSTLGQQMHFLHELEQVAAAARASGAWRAEHARHRIAAAWIGLRTMRANALRMLSGAESGQLAPESLIYKYHWSNWHRALGELAMDVFGADANLADPVHLSCATRTRLQGLFLFSRADTIYAGANEIQLNIIAERGLGMPKEPRGQA